MENLHIKQDIYTPEIILNTTGDISIKGKSYPENAFEFFEPIMDWIEQYFESTTNDKTTINLEITYFNSSTSKVLFDLFDILEENCDSKDIQVNWIYDKEDESSKEAGEEFIEDFESLKINLLEK